jgi:hypothetical protein
MGLPQTEKGYLVALENVMRTNDKTNSKKLGGMASGRKNKGCLQKESHSSKCNSLKSPKRNLKKPEVVP